MIKSQIYHGKIYAGSTQLACTIKVEQVGMQLTVKAGTFTHTNGDTWVLPTDQVFNLTSNLTFDTECKIEIGDIQPDGIVDVWCATKLNDGIEEWNVPVGWRTGHLLAFPFIISAGATSLDNVEIFVLEVLPGFPEPEQMQAMGIERGVDGSMRMTGRA
jgi:hypothetical protein